MAKKSDQKETVDLAKSLQAVLTNVDSLLSHMDSLFNNLSDKIKKTNTDTKSWRDTLEGVRNLNKSYTDSLEDSLKSQKARTLAAKSGLSIDVAALVIAKQQAIAAAIKEGASLSELHTLKRQFDIAIKNQKRQDEINKTKEAEHKLAEQINELEEKRKEILEEVGVNTKLIKDFLQGGVARTIAMTIAAKKMGEAYGEAFKELQGEGLAATQAAHEAMTSFTDSMSTGFLASSEEIRKARAAVMETGGTLHDAEEAGKGAAMMAKIYGGSLEDAGKAIGNLQKIPGLTKESAQNTAEFGAQLAIAANVPADTVTKVVAQNMDAAAKAGPNMTKSLALAAINAKKIGIEFSVITGMADKLLDFENSINAQMEASVLLGREINLDKAREAALAGDYATVQKEILKNVGSEAEFTKMNVLQKQKLAEAMGVSVADLAKMVKGQGELSDGTKLEAEARSEVSKGFETGIAFASKYSAAISGLVGGVISAIPQFMTLNMLKSQNAILTGANTTTTNINTGAQNTNSLATQRAGLAAKGAASGMLALGGAVLMIGAGIGLAALGIAQLADSMKGLSLPEFAGLAVILTGIGVGIYFLATASATAAPLLFTGGTALLYFGGGLALVGLGIGIAAAGIGYMVKQFGEIPYENLAALPLAFMGIGAGLYLMAAAGMAALPVLGALTALAVAAPALSGLAGSLGGMFGGEVEEKGGKEQPTTENNEFAALQEGINQLNTTMTNLYNLVSKGGKVMLNAKEVGDALYLYSGFGTKTQ